MKYEKSEKRNKCLNVGPSPLVSMEGLSNSNEEISKFRLHDWDGCNVSAITELHLHRKNKKVYRRNTGAYHILLSSYAMLQTSNEEEGNMKALDIMSVDIIAATENVSVIEVATRIVLSAINGMPVISKDDGKLLGVVTTIDILRAIRSGGDLTKIIAKEIISSKPISVKEDTDVNEIIDLMDRNRIMMVPVVQKDGRLIGVCSRSDVLKEILNERFVTIGMTRKVTRTIGESA